MNFIAITNVLSFVALICGFAFMSASAVAFLMGDPASIVFFFLIYSLVTIICTTLILANTRGKYNLATREGFLIVVFGWGLIILLGAIPFVWITGFSWIDAIFETASGFTTTGASIIDTNLILRDGTNLKDGLLGLPKGLIYWRSMTHWLGGMGVIVLYIAIMPYLGIGGEKLYHAEVSSAASNQLAPRITDTAKMLWGIYIIFSIIETSLLMIGGMSLFDAWCHTCGTLATGGFSSRPESISAFNSVFIESVIMVFMFLGSSNFILHHQMMKKGISVYFKDEEFRSNLIFIVISGLLLTFVIHGGQIVDAAGRLVDSNIFNSARYAFFQTISMKSCTGFCTADFNIWPELSRFLLLLLMIVGGCGGSTTGAIKHVRLILLVKYGIMQIKRVLFPHSLCNVTLNGVRIETETLHKVLAFFFVYMSTCAIGIFLLCFQNENDLLTSISAIVSCIGGVGPGISKVGAVCTYSWMSPFSKTVLSIFMLLGRLEIFTVMVIFLPTFWRK